MFGGYAAAVAAGLALRHDHGSQYMSDHFQAELAFLGIASSPAFVREPEGNGCAERFIRTLKEQLLWVRTFDTVEEQDSLASPPAQVAQRSTLGKAGSLVPRLARNLPQYRGPIPCHLGVHRGVLVKSPSPTPIW